MDAEERPRVLLRCAIGMGGLLAFASILGPWTTDGMASSVSGQTLADLISSGTTEAWVPRWVAVGLYLIPITGAAAAIGAGLPGRVDSAKALLAPAALCATITIGVFAALDWAPVGNPGWGASCLQAALLLWTVAAITVVVARLHAGRRTLTVAAVAATAALLVCSPTPGAHAQAPGSSSACGASTAGIARPEPVPVALLVSADEVGEVSDLERELRGETVVDVVHVGVIGEVPDPKSVSGATVLEEATAAEQLDSWQRELGDLPLAVVPVGLNLTQLQTLRAGTDPKVWVIDLAGASTAGGLTTGSVLSGYRSKITNKAGSSPLSVQYDAVGDGIELSAKGLYPGEVALAGQLTLANPDGQTVVCDLSGTPLPATVELGEDLTPQTLTVSTAVAGDQARPAASTSVTAAVVDGSTSTTEDTGAEDDRSSSSDEDEPDRSSSSSSSSEDDGSSGGVPIWALVLVAAVAGGLGHVITRNRGVGSAAALGGHAVAPAPTDWGSEHPSTHPFAAERPSPPLAGWVAAVTGGTDVRVEDLGIDRLLPHDLPEGRVWHGWTDGTSGIALWLEKRAGQGEDAEPTLRLHRSGRSLIGVYDGTGGSGASIARRTRDGRELSGAYVASRLAREVTETWFTQLVDSHVADLRAEDLRRRLADAFDDEALTLGPAGPVKGSLHRRLPTTLATIALDASESTPATIDVLWAGDSRAYLLTPDHGLQVLTVDDTRETDALELIRNDQPMNNLVSADRSFLIHQARHQLGGPAILLTATDGCFGYVRTPAHFEYLVLRTLLESADPGAWGANLLLSVSGYTADDASISLLAVGFADTAAMRSAFAARCEYLHAEHWTPFSSAEGTDADQLPERSWQTYRDLYHGQLTSRTAP